MPIRSLRKVCPTSMHDLLPYSSFFACWTQNLAAVVRPRPSQRNVIHPPQAVAGVLIRGAHEARVSLFPPRSKGRFGVMLQLQCRFAIIRLAALYVSPAETASRNRVPSARDGFVRQAECIGSWRDRKLDQGECGSGQHPASGPPYCSCPDTPGELPAMPPAIALRRLQEPTWMMADPDSRFLPAVFGCSVRHDTDVTD
jgi:hypothetical protein